MALAYAVVLVNGRMFDRFRRDTVAEAQREADKRFEKIAQDNMKGTVTRNPEPRVMTYEEMKQAFPYVDPSLVGLYFTADIT